MTEKRIEKSEIKKLKRFELSLLKETKSTKFNPVELLTKKIEDKTKFDLFQSLSGAFEKSLKNYLLNPVDKKEKLREKVFEKLEIRSYTEHNNLSVKKIEKAARKSKLKNEMICFFEGVLFGLGGVTSATIDIPVLLKSMYEVVESIAISFGMDPFQYEERVYIIKIISLALCDEKSSKEIILEEIHELEELICHSRHIKLNNHNKYSYDEVARNSAIDITKSIIKGKVYQSIPIIGSGAGAIQNYSIINKISEVALNTYKRRYLEKKWVYKK